MARPLRIEYPYAWYHVLNRGRNREEIFLSSEDYEKFLLLLGEVTALFGAEVHAYSLMPNHYHLLMCTPNANLSRIMRHLNSVYTQYINQKYERDGSLFRGRYKAILVNEEEYLLELVRYIHRNPLKAGLERRLGEHKWTSHRGYMIDTFCPGWLKRKEVLSRFGKKSIVAKREFSAFVKDSIPQGLEGRLDGVNWPAILGGEDFKDRVRGYVKGARLKDNEIPEGKKLRYEVCLDEIARVIERVAGMASGELSVPRKKGLGSVKAAFVYICREDIQSLHSEICQVLGGVNGSMVTRLYAKACADMQEKGAVCKLVQKVRKQLSQ